MAIAGDPAETDAETPVGAVEIAAIAVPGDAVAETPVGSPVTGMMIAAVPGEAVADAPVGVIEIVPTGWPAVVVAAAPVGVREMTIDSEPAVMVATALAGLAPTGSEMVGVPAEVVALADPGCVETVPTG